MSSAGNSICPFCHEPLQVVYVTMSGGVWLSESKRFLELYLQANDLDDDAIKEMRTHNKQHPLHCVIGSSGAQAGTWPKDGFFCQACGAFAVSPRPPSEPESTQ